MSKYGVISGPNTGKYGSEITPYLDTFHAVKVFLKNLLFKMDDHNFKNIGKDLQKIESLANLFSAKMRCNLHVIRYPEDLSDVLWMLYERFERFHFSTHQQKLTNFVLFSRQ